MRGSFTKKNIIGTGKIQSNMPKEWVQLKMEERILARWPDPCSKETKCQTKEIFNNLLRSAEISKEKFSYQLQ